MKYPHRDEFLAMSDEQQNEWIIANWRWYYAQESKPEIGKYWEECVAILGQQVVGHHPDPDYLRRTLTEQLNVHPDQLLIVWMGPRTICI